MALTCLTKGEIELAEDLIAYPSVTPNEAGCLTDLHGLLKEEGFSSFLVPFGSTTNLYARLGTEGPHLCFAGHIDVVPPGSVEQWTFPPFSPTRHGGYLYGRGVSDMKGAIACFISALMAWKQTAFHGSCSLLLTSDEEGPGVDGIPRMLPWLQSQGQTVDLFLIGEPTGVQVGQTLQVGRRGSVTGHLKVKGVQGHIAYPHLADNPLPRLIHCLQALMTMPLDQGNASFEPSHLEVTAIETGNPTVNLIPAMAEARFGIRFNPQQSALNLCEKIQEICQTACGLTSEGKYELILSCNGNPFLTTDSHWIQCVQQAMQATTGQCPCLSTRGGTTDGRFLCEMAPVLEVGMSELTMHQVDERVPLGDFRILRDLYLAILTRFFQSPAAA